MGDHVDIRFSSFNFPSTEDEGPQSASAQLIFPRAVQRVAIGITGYSATFQNHEDHHLGRLILELDAAINSTDPTKVDVTGKFGLRDWSNEWDDPYSGIVEYAVFADLVGVTPPVPGAPRGDLVIVDAEITQGIQHFRSFRHLNSANVFPDNSIRLVAGKPTIVRLYVDYDAASGLAPITSLSGELTVTIAGMTTAIAPLRTIVPRRDSSIDRGQRDHTLNFLIPENLCQGIAAISVRVFNTFDNTQFSANFDRTLTFEAMPDLPIMAVAIEYTGADVSDPAALAAPTMADFIALFGLTEALFPIPQVVITSFVTMSYDEDVKSNINDGCDKMGDLKDAVAELRGDSDDIVYGLYNSGVDTGSVGGCGGGGAAVGAIGSQGTAAHEVGHALGRKHAPCDNVTRCATPKNTDDDYPDYIGFDSDSIGEYGFDSRPTMLTVRDPASSHDMMGYSGGRWISPYTYKALMSRIPETFDGASAALSARAEAVFLPARLREDRGCWIPIKQPQLFLRLDINRDRSVHFRTSFHFDARPRPHDPDKSEFNIELLDGDGLLLRSACLYADSSGCGCSCGTGWPVKIRHAIAFDPRARTLVLYECDKELQRWPIPNPPKVTVDVIGETESNQTEIEIQWRAYAESANRDDFWYLVQWRDRRGTWRGVAPRTQRNSLRVPKRLFKGDRVAVRVLASSGIATGLGLWEGSVTPPPARRGAAVEISLVGVETRKEGAHPVPGVLRAVAHETSGEAVPGTSLRWYDSRGAEIGRGRALDLSQLPVGQHQITIVMPQHEGSTATWLIERTRGGDTLLLVGDQKSRVSPRRYRHPRDNKSEM